MPLLWNTKLQDPNKAVWDAIRMNNTMTGAQPGFQRGLWAIREAPTKAFVTFTGEWLTIWDKGKKVHNADVTDLADWDDVSCHQQFMTHPDHQDLIDAMMLVSEGNMQMFHTGLTLGMGTTVSPVKTGGPIDMVMGFFPVSDIGDLVERRSDSGVSTPSDLEVKVKAYASGWSMEDSTFLSDDLKEVERAGKGKERVWFAIYNWGDDETQRKARAAGIVESQTEWILKSGGERQIDHMVMADYSA